MEKIDSEARSPDEQTALVNTGSDHHSENSLEDDVVDTRSELKFERGEFYNGSEMSSMIVPKNINPVRQYGPLSNYIRFMMTAGN